MKRIEVPKDLKMYNSNRPRIRQPSKRAVTEKADILISFPYNAKLVENVKLHLPGRRWNPEIRKWRCPISIEAIEKLAEWEFDLDDNLKEILMRSQIRITELGTLDIPGLRKQLYPFQEQGVAFADAKKGRVLIADEMGLGKTVQALAYLQLHPKKRPVVIVCPASLKLNWMRETVRWIDYKKIEILAGKKTHRPSGDIIIINYDILYNWTAVLRQVKPQVIITDECHYYKNNSANRTKAVKMLAKKVPHFIALSGTPIVNRPVEGFNAINIIDPTVLPSFWHFAERYCGATNNGFGWDFGGATNTEELHVKLVNSIMIRRKKKDVLKDLPDKSRAFIPFELDNYSEYQQVENNFINFVQQTKGTEAANRVAGAEHLAQIEELKQTAVRGKMKNVVGWIRNFLESSDEKLVVFATHRFVIDRLMKEFPNISVKIDGSVSAEQRDRNVLAFQRHENIRLFVGNIKAAGVGITLTAASNVAFIEFPWSPGELVQAEDRLHRIGQKESVTVYYLLADGTIEEKMAKMLDEKRIVLDKILDGEQTETRSLLSELISDYYKQ